MKQIHYLCKNISYGRRHKSFEVDTGRKEEDQQMVVGLDDAEHVAEVISERVKTLIDPIPDIELEFKVVDGKKLVLLHVKAGSETPYYYIGDKQRIAFIRIGNESVTADRMKLKALELWE